MMRNNADKSTIRKFIYGGLLFIMLLVITATLAFSQDDRKVETIDSTALGTSTQMGSINRCEGDHLSVLYGRR
jgi:hypothetical protein